MIPLFSISQIREVDTFAINQYKFPSIVLMENAAISCFNIINQKYELNPAVDDIGFVCGKGNNGGDGFALARLFLINNFKIKIIYLSSYDEMSNDAKVNFMLLKNLSQNKFFLLKEFSNIKELNSLNDSSIIVDAILGSGTSGILSEPYKSIVEKLNSINCKKVSIDVPTGLNADTGFGEIIFKSDLTISLAELKKGLFFGDGFASSGDVVKGSIGTPESFFNSFEVKNYLIEPEDALKSLPIKKNDLNKYSAGKVLTIAGSGKYPGAAELTSVSAMKVGAGASILCFPHSIKNLVNKKYLSLVVQNYFDEQSEYLKKKNIDELSEKINWADVIALGPGLGRNEDTIEAVLFLLKKYHNKIFVIDADAIFALSKCDLSKIKLKNKILTPHLGEFSNLIHVEHQEIIKDMLKYGREFSVKNKCYLLLKGPRSLIFLPTGEILINTSGNVGMAKFGTGDVLTGVLAGLISQSKNIESSLISGIYIHGLAGDLLKKEYSEYSFLSEDLMNKLPYAIKFLRKSFV